MIEPGIYTDLAEEAYHADPALSSSGARQLLPPSCPAKYRWERDNGRAPKRAWDLGHAAHQRVLRVGPELVVVQKTTRDKQVVDADDYLTKSAQEHRDAIRAEGKVPLLRKELDQVEAMAVAIREHPVAGVLFDPELGGQPEVSFFWDDPREGIARRARFDWLPPVQKGGRLIIPDLKSTTSAAPGAFGRSVLEYGYAVQAVWYLDAAAAFELAEDVAFVFVAIEKTPPYLITIFELNASWMRIGRTDADRAMAVFAECTATDTWPPYSTDVELLSPPIWLDRQYEGVLL